MLRSGAVDVLKKWARRVATAAGVRKSPGGGWHFGRGRERASEWYDRAYAQGGEYVEPYSQSVYYPLWAEICERVARAGARRVLEIGCGTGQLAQMLLDRGVERYTGLDFSEKAIEIARRQVPAGEFVVGDARTSSVYRDVAHDVIVCTELLEHVEDDLAIVRRFSRGKRCLCSVPNFPYASHVRHFQGPEAVRERYGPFFDPLEVVTVKSPRNPRNEFYLLDGVRNEKERRHEVRTDHL